MFAPSTTVKLLNKLAFLGFNDEHLRIIHRKPGEGDSETIDSHRNYCKGCKSNKFVPGSRNEIVCKRLHFIDKHKDCIETPESFNILAKVAAKEFPFSDI